MVYRKVKACDNAGMLLHRRREVPQEPLLLVIRSFGGTAAWAGEGSPLDEADESITHQVGQPTPAKGHTVFISHLLDTWLNRRGKHSSTFEADVSAVWRPEVLTPCPYAGRSWTGPRRGTASCRGSTCSRSGSSTAPTSGCVRPRCQCFCHSPVRPCDDPVSPACVH